MIKIENTLLLLLVILLAQGCDFIAGIFQTGFWAGVILVIIVILIIVFIVVRARK